MCGRLETEALTVIAVIVYEDDFFHQVGRTLLQDAAARGSRVKRWLLHESFTLCTYNASGYSKHYTGPKLEMMTSAVQCYVL